MGTLWLAQYEPVRREGQAPLFHFGWMFREDGRLTLRTSTLQALDGPAVFAVA